MLAKPTTQLKSSPSGPEGAKHIYQGLLKDQISKTKQALKLTQLSQSRKAVQNQMRGTNTQSFRISQQSTLNPVASLQKTAPKIYLSKTKKHTKQPSIVGSNARGSSNMTKLGDQRMHIEELQGYSIDGDTVVTMNYQGMARPPNQVLTSSVEAAPVRTSVNSHRRSASDGNTIFYN